MRKGKGVHAEAGDSLLPARLILLRQGEGVPFTKGIAYVERDISGDEQAVDELSRLGYMTTPVPMVDGEVVVGFDQKRLEALLGSVSNAIHFRTSALDRARVTA